MRTLIVEDEVMAGNMLARTLTENFPDIEVVAQDTGNWNTDEALTLVETWLTQFPDVGGICHAHPPAATAFACAHLGLEEPLLGEAVMALGPVPCAPYGRTGTAELPAAAAPLMADHDALLLANHGALTMGPDLERAYWRMETLEHTAQIHLNVRLLGGGVPLTPEQAAALRGGV